MLPAGLVRASTVRRHEAYPSLSPPIHTLGRGSGSVLRFGFLPGVFQVDQESLRRAGRKETGKGHEKVGGAGLGAGAREETTTTEEGNQGTESSDAAHLLGLESSAGEEPEVHSVWEVEAPAERREGGHVVGVEAGDGGGGGAARREAGFGLEFVLGDVEAADAVPLEAAHDLGRYRAEVFTHQDGPVTLRLEAEDGEEFVGVVADVDTLTGGESFGNPIEAMEAHDVIEAEHAGDAEVVADDVDPVAIVVFAEPLGMEGGEAPILTAGEHGVGRGAAAGVEGVELGVEPDVEAFGVHAKREIKVEADPLGAGGVGGSGNLFVGEPLGVGEVARVRGGEVAGAKVTLAKALGPVRPGLAPVFGGRAKTGVAFDDRVRLEEGVELVTP